MKKFFVVFLAVCMTFSLAACNMDGEEVHSFLSGLAKDLGESQITEDSDLIGSRSLAEDAYTGEYHSLCDGNTGKDVVFGGGSIDTKKLHVYGTIQKDSGSAVVRIRQNEKVTELEPQADGGFETTLSCSSGGNYIMIDYDNFQGNVELHSEYVLE